MFLRKQSTSDIKVTKKGRSFTFEYFLDGVSKGILDSYEVPQEVPENEVLPRGIQYILDKSEFKGFEFLDQELAEESQGQEDPLPKE